MERGCDADARLLQIMRTRIQLAARAKWDQVRREVQPSAIYVSKTNGDDSPAGTRSPLGTRSPIGTRSPLVALLKGAGPSTGGASGARLLARGSQMAKGGKGGFGSSKNIKVSLRV